MTIKAKTIIDNKFWILESNGSNIGTLSVSDEQYMYTCDTGTKLYPTKNALTKDLGTKIQWSQNTVSDAESVDKIAYDFPTSTTPYNIIYDVKNKLPLFTKSEKSKSLYCAGYYIIQFDKGWVKSFCPKLVTLQKYNYKGPFKTSSVMREELSYAVRSTN